MTSARSAWQTFRGLPRAARWAIGAGVAVVVLIVWNDNVLSATEALNRRCDEMLADYARASASEQRLKNLRAMQDVIRGLGEVRRPLKEGESGAALNDTVNAVLKRHTVSNDSFSYRGAAPLPRGTLAAVAERGEEVRSVTGDLRFEAAPEEALSIIAELESSPDIASITSARITTQAGAGKVTVDLTVEAWVVSASRRAPRARGA